MQKIFSLIATFLLTQFSFAQKQSLLWQVSGNGLTKPSYIYGTIHLICEDDMNISNVLKQKFAQANKLYLELDMGDDNTMATVQSLSLLQGNKTLKDFFTTAEYNKIDNFFNNEVGMPLDFFEKMKPFVLISILDSKTLSCLIPASYEMSFVQMAKDQKKDIAGLETVQEQMSIFDNMPKEKQKKMVLEFINSFEEEKRATQHLINLYKKQQLDSVYNLAVSSPDIADFKDVLINNRNKKWIPILEKSMHNEACFIAVGAGHLGGEMGILNLLNKKGYKVEPI